MSRIAEESLKRRHCSKPTPRNQNVKTTIPTSQGFLLAQPLLYFLEVLNVHIIYRAWEDRIRRWSPGCGHDLCARGGGGASRPEKCLFTLHLYSLRISTLILQSRPYRFSCAKAFSLTECLDDSRTTSCPENLCLCERRPIAFLAGGSLQRSHSARKCAIPCLRVNLCGVCEECGALKKVVSIVDAVFDVA